MEPTKFYSLRYKDRDWANDHRDFNEYIKLLEDKAFCVSKILTDTEGYIYFEIQHLTITNIMEIPKILGQELIIDGDVVKIYDDYIE